MTMKELAWLMLLLFILHDRDRTWHGELKTAAPARAQLF